MYYVDDKDIRVKMGADVPCHLQVLTQGRARDAEAIDIDIRRYLPPQLSSKRISHIDLERLDKRIANDGNARLVLCFYVINAAVPACIVDSPLGSQLG
jgi:hypothetical protein